MKIFTHKGKPVGELGSDGILRKEMSSKFIFKKTNSIGLDADMIDEAPEETEIRVRIDKEKVYKITKKELMEHKTTAEFSDYGRQYFVPITKFNL